MCNSGIGGDSYLIRWVASVEELEVVFDLLGAQFTPPVTHNDRIFSDLANNFPQDRRLMVIAEQGGRIVGGVLGFGNIVRMVALLPEAREKGLGRRLIQTYEVGAMRRGVQTISLGALAVAKGFYERVGYHGKSSMYKELPLPGRVREFRLRKLEAKLGDLEVGQVVQTDATDKIPPLF